MSQSFIVQEALWRPSANVQPTQTAIVSQPGSSLPPQRLGSGWQFHWPLLSVIRVFHHQSLPYPVDSLLPLAKRQWGDEPIVAVTKDHHLVCFKGIIWLQLSNHASLSQLANLNRYHPTHLIRPLVRLGLRQAVQPHPVAQLADKLDSAYLQTAIQAAVTDAGIIIKDIEHICLSPYKPPTPPDN